MIGGTEIPCQAGNDTEYKICHPELVSGSSCLRLTSYFICLPAEIIYPQAVFNTLELHAKAAVEFALR